jgi:hypothetical protein
MCKKITTCYECERFASMNGLSAPMVDSDDINQDTGLCLEVCDMERENHEIEDANDSYYAEDY